MKCGRGGIVVTPVDTSLVVEEAVRAAGGKVDYTAIGSPIVTGRMREVGAVFGGEGNGGLVFPHHQHCRDGLMSAAAMLDLIARSEAPLSAMVDALPKFERRKAKVECSEGLKAEAMKFVEEDLGERVSVRVDGLKIVDGEGWALVRTSGTEPIIRVVAESRNLRRTEEIAGELRGIVAEAVRKAEGLSRK